VLTSKTRQADGDKLYDHSERMRPDSPRSQLQPVDAALFDRWQDRKLSGTPYLPQPAQDQQEAEREAKISLAEGGIFRSYRRRAG
jgi:hypothetical protein